MKTSPGRACNCWPETWRNSSTKMISLVPPNVDELGAEAENCRQQAREADALTMRILNELADQYEAQARLLSAYPEPHRSSSG